MFHTNTKNGLTILTADTLSGVCHGFSTRPGGVSPAPWDSLNLGVGRGDEIARVQENYRRFCAALGTDVNRVVLSKQIHEDVVRHVTEADAGKGLWRDRDYPSVDGMVTDQPDLTDDLYENAALHSETGAWQMIFGVVTRPEYRKHGLAAQLLNRAIADARQQGRKGLVLTCKDKLVHYYAKFGFVNEGVSQSTHGNVAWNQMRLTF